MEVRIQDSSTIWHSDCDAADPVGMVRIVSNDHVYGESHVRCVHCGERGIIPFGSPFNRNITIQDE